MSFLRSAQASSSRLFSRHASTLPSRPALNLTPQDSTSWWRKTTSGQPGNQYSGRTLGFTRQADFTNMYRRLQGIMSRTGVRRDLRLQEYHEKSSDRRRRIESERHRRRFQEMVRSKVQMVQMIRNRG